MSLRREADVFLTQRYRAEDGRRRPSPESAAPAGANARREAPFPGSSNGPCGTHPGSTVQEILERAATDTERSIKLPSIRNELQSGRRQGKYESNGRRWSLAGSNPGATVAGEAASSDAPSASGPNQGESKGTLGLTW